MSHTIHYTKSVSNYVAVQRRDGSTWTSDRARIEEHMWAGHPLEAQLHPKFDCPSCLGSFATPELQELHFVLGAQVSDYVEEADRFIDVMPDGAIIEVLQIKSRIGQIKRLRELTGMSLFEAKMFLTRVEVEEVVTYKLNRK
jgi:hypothetical protein